MGCGARAREGDLVLRLVQRTAGMHKLSPPWEGPFIVSKALKNDAYYLVDAQEPDQYGVDRAGDESKRPWNVSLLRPFYSYKPFIFPTSGNCALNVP